MTMMLRLTLLMILAVMLMTGCNGIATLQLRSRTITYEGQPVTLTYGEALKDEEFRVDRDVVVVDDPTWNWFIEQATK